MTDKQRREKAAADLAEFRLEQARKNAAAKEASLAEGKKQTTTASGGVKPEDRQMLNSSENAKIDKAIAAQQKPVPPVAAPVAASVAIPTPAPVAPVPPTAPVPAVTSPIDPSNVFPRDASGNILYPEKMSPSGRAGAESFAKSFPDLAKQLEAEGKFAILGAGSGDNSLYNTYGAQTRKDIIEQINQGKLIGPHGGNEGFYNKTIIPALAAAPPDTPLGAELARLREAEPKGGTRGALGKDIAVQDNKLVLGKNQVAKALKAGGPAALLMAISEAANAKEVASIIGESLLPVGVTPSELQSGKLTAKQLKAFEEAQKLGSPYRSVPPPKK
jgi:hypothetical protein